MPTTFPTRTRADQVRGLPEDVVLAIARLTACQRARFAARYIAGAALTDAYYLAR